MDTLERILLVEDEADIRTVARMALEMVGGFKVLVCASGKEALQKVTEFAPQLVLLDVMMPGMDGPETLAALRTTPIGARLPVIFMTARAQSHEVSYLKQLGALAVITKPFDPMILSSTVNDVWLGHRDSSP
jgi:CheY-like chemotaxis protein